MAGPAGPSQLPLVFYSTRKSHVNICAPVVVRSTKLYSTLSSNALCFVVRSVVRSFYKPYYGTLHSVYIVRINYNTNVTVV